MKRKRKTPIFLVIGISFLLALLSAYMHYYVLMEADFLSASPKFENTDLDSLLLLKRETSAALTGFSLTFRDEGDLTGLLSSSYFPVMSPRVKTFILRC